MQALVSAVRARWIVALAVAVAAVLVAGVTFAVAGRGSSRPSRLITAASSTTTSTELPPTSAASDTTATPSTEVPTTTAAPTSAAPTTAAPTSAPRPRASTSTSAARKATTTTARGAVRTTVTTLRTVKVPRIPSSAPALADGGGPFRGFGAWVDVYDWTLAYTKNNPTVGIDDIDRMADLGVQTLYIQAARGDTADDVAEADRLGALIDRAHARKMAVVAWYLPYLTNVDDDMRHIQAIASLPIEGLGVDIESRSVSDVNERNQRVVDLSAAVRQQIRNLPVAAIVLPPVVTEVINTSYWPGFPWQQIAPFYDVWMPMAYWTNRTQASGWRDAYRYTVENVNRLRADLGKPDAVVHPVGGIGDKTTVDDVDAFLRAVNDTRSVGGSLYDYVTSGADQWARLRALRAE